MSDNDQSIEVPANADLIQRIEAFILKRFEEMTDFEYDARLQLSTLDPDTAKLFFVRHDGPNVIIEWPAGSELLSIDRVTLTQGLDL